MRMRLVSILLTSFFSFLSITATPVTAQTCPTNLQAFPDYGQNLMVIEWNLSVAGNAAAEFQIFRGDQWIATVDGLSNTTIDHLPTGSTYSTTPWSPSDPPHPVLT